MGSCRACGLISARGSVLWILEPLAGDRLPACSAERNSALARSIDRSACGAAVGGVAEGGGRRRRRATRCT